MLWIHQGFESAGGIRRKGSNASADVCRNGTEVPTFLLYGVPKSGVRREWNETCEGQVRGVTSNLRKDLGHIQIPTSPTVTADGSRLADISRAYPPIWTHLPSNETIGVLNWTDSRFRVGGEVKVDTLVGAHANNVIIIARSDLGDDLGGRSFVLLSASLDSLQRRVLLDLVEFRLVAGFFPFPFGSGGCGRSYLP